MYIASRAILVDGTDVGTLTDKNEFRRQFGMVSQHDFFFNMSIKENMLFGLSEQRSDEEITRALQLVNLWDDVTKLDQGLPIQTIFFQLARSNGFSLPVRC